MTDAIGPKYPLPPSQTTPSTTNVPTLAKQMQTQIQELADSLQKTLDDPSLSEQQTFLQKLSEHILHLNRTVEEVNKLR